MESLRHLFALCYRLFALFVLALVLYFPAYKGIMIAYGPVLLALAAASVLHKRIAGGWDPLGGWPAPRFFALILLAPALIQAALLLGLRPEPRFDGLFVYNEAVTLAASGSLSPLTYYPPAQAWWYALWFKAFGVSPLVAQLSHVPLHAAVTLLTYGFARRAVPAHARVAAGLVAFYPSFAGYVLTTPYYHYLYTAMIVAGAWGLLASLERPRGAALAGLASGLGALTKATQLIAPAQAIVFWLLAPRHAHPASRIPHLASRTALFLLGMAVVIAPWTYRNWRVFEAFVPVCTSGGLVLHSANNPESNGLYSGLPDAASIATPGEMLAHSRASSERAQQFIREDPVAFLRLAWVKILHTWGGESTFAELINWRGRPLGWLEDVFSVVFYFGWVVVAGWWGATSLTAIRRKMPLDVSELVAGCAVLSNAVVYAVFEGGDRHHLPLVPLLVVAVCAVASRPLTFGAASGDAAAGGVSGAQPSKQP